MYMPTACLFDLDGLLLDTETLHGQAWSLAAECFGLKLTKNQLLLLRGRRRFDCAKQIAEWIAKPPEIPDLLKTHQPISKHLLSQAKAMPGAESLVRWCFEKNVKMALVTSSSSDSVAFKSAPHYWIGLIKERVYGDDSCLSKGKPAPDPYLLAAKRLGVDPKTCWALEDSESGEKSALAAGCKVWVLKDVCEDQKSEEKYLATQSNPIRIKHLKTVLSELQKAL